jgi:hypothetical protein
MAAERRAILLTLAKMTALPRPNVEQTDLLFAEIRRAMRKNPKENPVV